MFLKNRNFCMSILLLVMTSIFSGCVTSAESTRLRKEFTDEMVKELNRAADEAKVIYIKELKAEAIILLANLDMQTQTVLKTLKQVEATGQNITIQQYMDVTAEHTKERDRIKGELYNKARKLSHLIRVYRQSADGIQTLEETLARTDAIQQQLIIDSFKVAATAVAAVGVSNSIEGIDPEMLVALTEIFSGFTSEDKPGMKPVVPPSIPPVIPAE
jgi:hypothetical protein